MKLAEWVDEKLRSSRLLSEYPMGEFLPFKINSGDYVKLTSKASNPGDDYEYFLSTYHSDGRRKSYIGLHESGLDYDKNNEYAINWDEPVTIPKEFI